MKFQQSYLNAIATGDWRTARAIERLNRNDYNYSDRIGLKQERRDRMRAIFGESYKC